jgi:hypothetical protein
MRIIFIIAGLLLGTIGTASAASLKDTREITITPVSASWSAIWGAALLGYSMSNTEVGFEATIAKLDGFGGEGIDGTVQIGGDIEIRGLLVGGWAEYSFGGTESELRVLGGKLTVEQNDAYGVFARVGLPLGDTLLYGAAGYVWTEADVSLTGGYNETFDFSGPAAEVGIERRFGPNFRAKLAARYEWFDEETVARYEDVARITAEPGVLTVKAGVVISTGY